MPNKCALIVDDSTTAQYRLKKMLRAYDLDIDAVDSGEAALRYLANNAPDVIFMDHLMPGMDGFRALQIIKSHPETAMIPVIMYTSKSGDVYTGQARALGALDVVSKDSINAADLSKVMQAIRIFRKDDASDTPSTSAESPAFVSAANQVSDPIDTTQTQEPPPMLERRALNQASLEQARNLELRMSHLEHTLEDSRRFITSRVVRELHGLRDNLKQELSLALTQQQQPTAPPPALPEPPVSQPVRRPIFSLIAIALALGVMTLYLVKMNTALEQSQSQQTRLSTQLQQLNDQQTASPAQPPQALSMVVPPTIAASAPSSYADDSFLADLSWTFNQGGTINFHQNSIDPKALVNLHEFLRRLISKGFSGDVLISIYVGNFCIVIDNAGLAQLPPANSTLGSCMLSSEIYGLDRVAEQYQQDMEAVLYGLIRNPTNTINVIFTTTMDADNYPERLPIVTTKEWNTIAQGNNRFELELRSAPLPD